MMADQARIKTQVLVSRGPFSEGKWAIEDVTLRNPREDEVIVEIVASGICHTDLHCGDTRDDKGVPGVFYPRVLGHEGSGYVTRVGSAVTNVHPGDAVLLSFSYCGTCHVCQTGPASHCTRFYEINFVGEPVFSSIVATARGEDSSIHGRFFGQSSFARHTIVSSKSVVNVSALNLSRADLQLLAPLGCGLQTGSGTVINVAQAGPNDSIAILGMGGVGLAAVMAAKLRGCHAIVGIDRVPSRLALAKSLGATHTIDTSGMAPDQLSTAIRNASPEGLGVTIAIDTSASPALVSALLDGTRYMGSVIQVGTGMPEARLSLHMQSFMVSGKTYRGAVQGHCRTSESVPQMVKWWREGVFPVEKLVRFWDVKEFEKAVVEMGKGEVVKPILVW